jgi:phosphoribosylamine--glycine ligase
LEGDAGPNTGGMGAFSPVPVLSDSEAADLCERVHAPVLAELARRGAPFRGLLYAGLMLTDRGPRVLEFNCRLGDPETQALLPRLEGDLLEPLLRAASGDLGSTEVRALDAAAVTVVLAAPGYPDSPRPGTALRGLADAAAEALVFHAGTALRDGELVAAGGRVLNVTGLGGTVADARRAAYAAVASIDFPSAQYRRDIAEGAVPVAA